MEARQIEKKGRGRGRTVTIGVSFNDCGAWFCYVKRHLGTDTNKSRRGERVSVHVDVGVSVVRGEEESKQKETKSAKTS